MKTEKRFDRKVSRFGTILAAVVAAAIGLAWFAIREREMATEPVAEKTVRRKLPKTVPAKIKQPVAAPTAKVNPKPPAEEKREPDKQETRLEEKTVQVEQAAQEKKDGNPFPRYLDMFKNNPEALAAEFQKEAEADRASLAKVREHAIAQLKLNPEQVAMFEKALGDLRDEVTRINEEWVGLIRSGQLNDEDDGSIFTSNRLLGQRFVAAREKAMRETAEKLYEQLALDGVSDAEKQRWLYIAASRTASSYECLEPCLTVYDKLYKNYGIGDSIFSWCRRPHPQEKK